ncbi:MAG TPA: NUDIX domain-containing protein [Nitriliruptorales bacterium]
MPELVPAAGAVILDEAGRLLVVRRAHPPAQDRWSLPAGRLRPGETTEVAAVREVREETGLEVEVTGLAGTLAWRGEDGGGFAITDHLARVTGGEPRAGDDAAELRWVTRSQLTALPTTAGLLAFLDDNGIELAP